MMECESPCVLPHDEGILWVEAGASIGVSFCWHECTEEPRGDPWPVLEIRKAIADQEGASHVAAHFTTAWGVFRSVNGRNVYTPDAFRHLNDSLFDGELRPTTNPTKFLSDSRDILLFHCHDGSSLESRFCSHFDKYSGGDVRLLWSGREIGPLGVIHHPLEI